MFGPFLALLGIDDPSKTQARETVADSAAAQLQETERRRKQIQRLAAYLKTAKVRAGTRRRLVESVRQVSEVVIWSDRRNPELLSLAVEEGLHRHMLALLHARAAAGGDSAVAVQVLQTFSIILDSVSDTKFLYALFSNNFVNELIAAPVDLDNEEVVSYYAAFLKALSLRLTGDTIHFFFNERLDDFPLYTTAIALFDHADPMVRVAVRAVTLNVFRINDPSALEFILHSPRCAHFWEQVMCSLKDSYDDAFRLLVDMLPMARAGGAVATSAVDRAHVTAAQGWAAVDQVLEAHMGLLAYLNDVYGLGVDRISRRITGEFAGRILERTFVHAIEVGWRAGASPEETLFMQVVTLFVAHFFSIVRHSPLLVDAVAALFVDGGSARVRLAHPFIPSPFEPSRTLAPWLCAVLEILRNKAISPTALVKSVLTPRRMLRTRALLESLTGSASQHDCCSSSATSVTSVTSAMAPLLVAAPPSDRSPPPSDRSPPPAPLPPHTQTIATAMVQILAEDPPTHTWITVDLAALVLAQLTRSSRGQLVLDASLGEELALAQRARSAELRALLLAASDADGASQLSQADGAWKVLVQSLADLANSDAETLTMKVQFEARHVFAPERAAMAPADSPSTLPRPTPPRRASTSSAAHPLALLTKAVIGPPASAHSSHSSLLSLSPFEALTPYHVTLAASIHQAFHLARLSKHAASAKPLVTRGSFVPALQAWLGQGVEAVAGAHFAATVIDNAAKRALPRSVPRLGFPAAVQCQDGCLVIQQAEPHRTLELVWPLADVAVACEREPADEAALLLRIRDTAFPPLFFPPRPASLGGLNTAVRKSRARTRSAAAEPQAAARQHLAQYAYLGTRNALDISLRMASAASCDALSQQIHQHITISRQRLAGIYLDHNVV
ncbi:Protein CL16A [Coemansia sp. RSA 2611]|nr:Protein CL16A [Coemansia sp. RSA 2610]KAJ2385322.1 Protein CL16A [Coemansia sp. RSA 2611]